MTDFGSVARWFLAIGALIYATGFLVAVSYADYLGATGFSNQLFREQYILIGLLCLALPTIVIGGAYGLMEHRAVQLAARAKRQQALAAATTSDERESAVATAKAEQGSERTLVARMILVFNLLLTFYLFVMFAPRGYLQSKPWIILAIFFFTVLGYRLVGWSSKIVKDSLVGKVTGFMDWLLCLVIVCVLDAACFWEMRARLLEVLYPRGMNFLLFVATIVYITYRLKAPTPIRDARSRSASWVIGGCELALLYVLAVYAFAYGVYPEIAASRGGGDHTDDSRMILTYSPDLQSSIPIQAQAGNGHSQPLVLLEETPDVLVVADPKDSGGPAAWRTGAQRPTVMAISRRAVLASVSVK
jgi:hypothetical protein